MKEKALKHYFILILVVVVGYSSYRVGYNRGFFRMYDRYSAFLDETETALKEKRGGAK